MCLARWRIVSIVVSFRATFCLSFEFAHQTCALTHHGALSSPAKYSTYFGKQSTDNQPERVYASETTAQPVAQLFAPNRFDIHSRSSNFNHAANSKVEISSTVDSECTNKVCCTQTVRSDRNGAILFAFLLFNLVGAYHIRCPKGSRNISLQFRMKNDYRSLNRLASATK